MKIQVETFVLYLPKYFRLSIAAAVGKKFESIFPFLTKIN